MFDVHDVADNESLACTICEPAQVAYVLKANAYGLGMIPVAAALARAGCSAFFLATSDEALTLRMEPPSVDIYCFGEITIYSASLLHRANIIPVLHKLQQIREWATLAEVKPTSGARPPPEARAAQALPQTLHHVRVVRRSTQ